MQDRYRNGWMNWKTLFVLYSAFIFAVLLVSAMQISQTEGFYNSYKDYNENFENASIQSENSNRKISGNTSAIGSTINEKHIRDSIFKSEYGNNPAVPATIQTNGDFLVTVNSVLSAEQDQAKDKVAIYEIQGKISSLKTKNAAILMSEIGNPNNVNNPRVFLQYMNWFGSNCPIDADTCVGLNN